MWAGVFFFWPNARQPLSTPNGLKELSEFYCDLHKFDPMWWFGFVRVSSESTAEYCCSGGRENDRTFFVTVVDDAHASQSPLTLPTGCANTVGSTLASLYSTNIVLWFGGLDTATQQVSSAVHAHRWHQSPQSTLSSLRVMAAEVATTPCARAFHSLTAVADGSSCAVLYGGFDGSIALGDTWLLHVMEAEGFFACVCGLLVIYGV